MRSHPSARSRLTLLYASLFTLGGTALVLITYLLVAHTLHSTTPPTIPPSIRPAIGKCVVAAQTGGGPGVLNQCAALYASGVQAGASAQRSTTLTHLLTYSLLGLAGAALLAAAAGWIAAGRILAPVHRLTAAARAASEQDLSQRIALRGPRDDLRELADTFDTMLERLDRAFTSQRQFIANASHELRTPLTLMRTAMDVVLAKPEPTRGELVSMAADVRQAVDQSERLIEALLVLARNDQARALTDPLDLAAVAEDALEGRTTNGITTATTLDKAPVTGDGVLLERLVANLLDNAERYNVVGGTVSVLTTTENSASLVRVVNTGQVVPPGQVERLFLPFTRLDDRTRHDGFGLGLALVSSIATVHNGTVHATALPAGGLDITVRLPRRDNAATPARQEGGPEHLGQNDHHRLWEEGRTIMTEPVDIPGYIVGTWDIDPVHSHIGFIARHLMVSKVRGNFTKFEGQIVTAANPLESSAMVTVDISSLDTGNEARDNDVKGEGFLDVANHPTMTFQSTGVHSSGDDLIMTGDLTIKGTTRLVELGIEVNGFGPDPYGGTKAGFTATGELYRSDYGITANTVLPTGGVVVSDDIQLVLDVEASLRTS